MQYTLKYNRISKAIILMKFKKTNLQWHMDTLTPSTIKALFIACSNEVGFY